MSAADLSEGQVATAIKRFGNYRTRRCQQVALEGHPDGISGATIIALGLRETGLKNVNGGAILEGGQWVSAPPWLQDGGVFQISRVHHAAALSLMLAVDDGTWSPVINGNAGQPGKCPRFEDSLRFTIEEMQEAQAFADDHGVPELQWPRFAIAAHNAGKGGALAGWRDAQDFDAYSTHGDYSKWVLHHAALVRAWLGKHQGWRVSSA